MCQLDLDARNSNMGKIILVLMVAMIGLVRSQFEEFELPSPHRTPLGNSVDIASMKFLKETYKAAEDKNVVTSPLGVLTLLSLYASGADGENREEIVRYLGASDYKQLEASYKQLSQRFANMDHSFMTVANKIFVSNQFTLQDQFVNVARSYRNEVENIDFGNQKLAADAMNEWSSKNTNGTIATPVSASDVDPAAAVALLNVIFFQGHFYVPFKASRTAKRKFHLNRSNSVDKPMMHLYQSLHYHESDELGARMIELPYQESLFRMVIVLPDEIDGLPAVLEKAAQNGLLGYIFELFPIGAKIELDMPKFEIKSKLDLNELLPKVGVSRIFEEAAAGIVKEQGVSVGKGLQEAFVKVDEEGAIGGAATGPFSAMCTSQIPVPFNVDHPFLFAILHDDIILFAGTYSH